ncbi:Tetratricopeptide repeat protein 6, partial [Globisporangium splendens]
MSTRQQSKDSDNGSEVRGGNDESEDDDNDFGSDEVKIDPSSAHLPARDDEARDQIVSAPGDVGDPPDRSVAARRRDHAAASREKVVDAVKMYLNEGDQHMTVDELFNAALEAEKQKLWKRAILLTSACIVIDCEFLQVVLLRARCCRRIGLWTQAIKDLGHALLLRADIFHTQSNIGASLQDLATALNLDPSCWRAYCDRATIRIRAIEGDEQSLSYHWEHMKYEQLLVSIIEDYINALRKGCKMVEVVETVGDLTVRLLEFTGDASVLRQVIHNLSHLLQILSIDRRDSLYATHHQIGGNDDSARPTVMERELLIAAIHAQRGRLFVLFNDRTNAAIEFDHAVVSEYHYPVAHFYRGAFAALLSKDDDIKTNLQHLTKCIALDPTIAGAYTVRGALHLRDLKFNNALQDFKAAVATDPTLYEVWLQIALIYLNHCHDCDACIKACTNASTNDSCLARALYLRGEAYTRQGNTTVALKGYGRLTIAQPDGRWAQLMRGRLLLHLKLARPAFYSFILFMEQGSANGDKRAHFLCGMAFKILSRFQKAVDEFQRTASLNPTSENLMLLSESLHSMGDTENSLRVSEKVISADPGSFKGYVRRAQLLVSVSQFQHAMSEYDKALSLAPKEGRVYYERGIVQMQLYMRWRIAWQLNFDPHTTAHDASGGPEEEEKQEALAIPSAALCDRRGGRAQRRPHERRAHGAQDDPYVDRAELYALGEEYDKAFHDFECAIERNPKCVRAYVNLGVLKCQFAAFAAAIDDFDKAIKYDPKLPLVFFNGGVAYHKLSLWKQAEASYDQCIALAGGKGRYVDAHRNRVVTKCQLGDFEGALRDFDDVRQCAPDDDQLHGGLGYVLLQLGRYEDAAKSFATYGRLSRDTFGDSGNAYFNLANQQESLDHTTHLIYLKTALRFYLRAARIQPCNNDMRLNIANCLRKQREFAKAIMQCDIINSMKPHHHASLERKTVTSRDEARREASTPSSSSSPSNRANPTLALESNNDGGTAVEKADRPTRVTPPVSEIIVSGSSKQLLSLYMMNRGILYEQQGDFEQARQNYHDAIHFDALSVHAQICMGTLHLLEAKYDDSITHLMKALEMDANSGIAHINMGVAYLCVDKVADALTHFDAAIKLVPNCGYAFANKAVALARTGDLAQAEYNFKRAIEVLPSRKEFYLARGKIIAQQKRLQDAMVDFSTALFLGYEGEL